MEMSKSDAHFIFVNAQKIVNLLDQDIKLLKSQAGQTHASAIASDQSRLMFINETMSELMDANARAGWWNRRVAKSLLDEIVTKSTKCLMMVSILIPDK